MKNKYLFIIFIVFGFSSLLKAQTYNSVNHKEMALNMTPLLWTLTPLNVNKLPLQPYNFKYRKFKNGRIFNFAMGATLDIDKSDVNINFLVGKEKRHEITSNWNYYIGHNLVFGLNSLEEVDNFFGPSVEAYVGYSNSYVIEYDITERISIYTQASFILAFSNVTALKFTMEAPIALFFNVKI